MPRPPLPPRIKLWRGYHYLIYFDPQTKREVRKSCWRLGAHTADQRKVLLELTRDQQKLRAAESTVAGGNLAYGTNLKDALKMYLDEVWARVEGGTLKHKSAQRLKETVGEFRDWIPDSLKTGQLDGPTMSRFLRMIGEDRSPGSVNVYKRNLKTCLRYLATIRPRMFPDVDVFDAALKLSYVLPEKPDAFTPAQLKAFRLALPADQRELFDVYALTGMRLAEIDTATLANGMLTVVASKTGRRRVVPLHEVAPKLAKRGITGQRIHRPSWMAAQRRSGVVILPQLLRKNFVSYCAAFGIPASVAADWCGHSVLTSERHYRGAVLARNKRAVTIEGAMGL